MPFCKGAVRLLKLADLRQPPDDIVRQPVHVHDLLGCQALSASQHKKLGNLPFTAYAVAAIPAAEAIKVVLGKPGQIRNRLLMIDLLDGSADEMELR